MKNKRINNLSNKIYNALEIPREISEKETKFTIIGFDEMLIENYIGIIEYEEFYIKVNTRYRKC